MSCPITREALGAYVDGELAPDEAATVAEHLTTCADCARDYDAVLETVRTLREGLVRHRAPDVLRARVRAALREEAPARVQAPRKRAGVPWRALAAAAVVAVASSGLTLAVARRDVAPRSIASEEVLTSHIRSLMPDHLVDVRSNDQHNVKPWFNGRLDFSPTVPRLDSIGFPLIGGRLDYLHGRPVAAVVYARRQHMINAYSWPADAGDEDVSPVDSRHGYNLVHWRRGGVEHWVVSDLNAGELGEFVRAVNGER
ncbi:MAG TPA: anti-sigma factor [Gemmatimonadaceae bacterium]|jgi:anti-sigma factor RsiW|nr:anti-sigma factor [Gemmatimonadaceae bacterium]